MKKIFAKKEFIQNVPTSSGVYVCKDKSNTVIYVGKAKNLKNRLRSYFASSLAPKTKKMMSLSRTIGFTKVASEFEALLLEAHLVKKYKPQFNIALKDDKTPLYIGITKEELPRIVLLRQRELALHKLQKTYGPFINTHAPRRVLAMIRKIFPFGTHRPGKRACVYSQIGLCNPCPSDILKNKSLKKEYLKNIGLVSSILSGKSKALLVKLNHEMKEYSRMEMFEKAREIKHKISALLYTITRQELDTGYLENPNLLEDIRAQELRGLKNIIHKVYKVKKLKRIECFDIAHLAGSYPTASMVTFINGEPDKSLYRHYKINGKKKRSDTDSLGQVLIKRKFRFKSWGKPDLIIVDGGKGQLSAALKAVVEVPIVGLAKREETLVFKKKDEFLEMKLPDSPEKRLVQRIRDEAHRFARSYHHKLVGRAIFEA